MLDRETHIELIDILLIEDNPADILLMEETLAGVEQNIRLSVAIDGVQAMDRLEQKGHYLHAGLPDLILLDLNLPKKNGREVLEEIKSNPGLREIPVVVLTTSRSPDDIKKSYLNFANCYITKPVDLGGFEKMVRSIVDFWFHAVTLPKKEIH